jgi:hypothetical protein
MTSQIVVHKEPIAVWDLDLMKNAVYEGIDNGIDKFVPQGNALTKAGVSLCIDKTADCTSEFVKDKLTSQVADYSVPVVNASVDSCKDYIAVNSKDIADPLVDACTETTSNVSKGVMHWLVDYTFDCSYSFYNRIVSYVYPK